MEHQQSDLHAIVWNNLFNFHYSFPQLRFIHRWRFLWYSRLPYHPSLAINITSFTLFKLTSPVFFDLCFCMLLHAFPGFCSFLSYPFSLSSNNIWKLKSYIESCSPVKTGKCTSYFISQALLILLALTSEKRCHL